MRKFILVSLILAATPAMAMGKKAPEKSAGWTCGQLVFPAGESNQSTINGNNDDGNDPDLPPPSVVDGDKVIFSTGGGNLKCVIPLSTIEQNGYTAEKLINMMKCSGPNPYPSSYLALECDGPRFDANSNETNFTVNATGFSVYPASGGDTYVDYIGACTMTDSSKTCYDSMKQDQCAQYNGVFVKNTTCAQTNK